MFKITKKYKVTNKLSATGIKGIYEDINKCTLEWRWHIDLDSRDIYMSDYYDDKIQATVLEFSADSEETIDWFTKTYVKYGCLILLETKHLNK